LRILAHRFSPSLYQQKTRGTIWKVYDVTHLELRNIDAVQAESKFSNQTNTHRNTTPEATRRPEGKDERERGI
jgi:hypothetical protein